MNKEWKQKDQVEGSCNRQMERVHGLKITLGDRPLGSQLILCGLGLLAS